MSADGAFFSAEDADSEGEEGRFYVWTPSQLTEALGPDDATLVTRRYGVTPQGNFEHGTSILHEVRSLEILARERRIAEPELEARLAAARTQLLEARSRRPRPHLDDKVITAWNGLMISGFARGARVLGEPVLAERAVRAAEFLWTRLWNGETRTLARRWRDGEAGPSGQLDDYADLALAFIDLYETTFDVVWLEHAGTLSTEGTLLRVEWRAGDRRLHLVGNFGPEPIDDVPPPQGERVFATDDALSARETSAMPGYAVCVVVADTVDGR